MKKGFAHILLVLIITIVGVGTIGYYAYKKGQVKITRQNTSTEKWNTYINTKYAYSVKFPEDWNFKEDHSTQVYFFPKDETYYQTAISIWTTDKNTIFNPIIGGVYETVRDVLVDGQKVEIKKYQKGLTGFYLIASLQKDDNTFNFRYSEYLDKKYELYFDQILSTLKFLDPKRIASPESECQKNNATWEEKYKECVNMDENKCLDLGGKVTCATVEGGEARLCVPACKFE